jgi:hypothetical protein
MSCTSSGVPRKIQIYPFANEDKILEGASLNIAMKQPIIKPPTIEAIVSHNVVNAPCSKKLLNKYS